MADPPCPLPPSFLAAWGRPEPTLPYPGLKNTVCRGGSRHTLRLPAPQMPAGPTPSAGRPGPVGPHRAAPRQPRPATCCDSTAGAPIGEAPLAAGSVLSSVELERDATLAACTSKGGVHPTVLCMCHHQPMHNYRNTRHRTSPRSHRCCSHNAVLRMTSQGRGARVRRGAQREPRACTPQARAAAAAAVYKKKCAAVVPSLARGRRLGGDRLDQRGDGQADLQQGCCVAGNGRLVAVDAADGLAAGAGRGARRASAGGVGWGGGAVARRPCAAAVRPAPLPPGPSWRPKGVEGGAAPQAYAGNSECCAPHSQTPRVQRQQLGRLGREAASSPVAHLDAGGNVVLAKGVHSLVLVQGQGPLEQLHKGGGGHCRRGRGGRGVSSNRQVWGPTPTQRS